PASPCVSTLSLHDALPISRSATRATRIHGSPDPIPATRLPCQRPPAAIRTSLPLKCRLALLQERAKAFFRIGHGEEAVLQLPFESQAFVHRHLGPFRHGPFDESDRA